jgi:diaminopimelate epimerase
MAQQFYKYQGTGNDFIMIDDRSESFDENNQVLIEKLCDRRFGIGADGLILLRNAEGYDFRMVYFNADGREGSMCGNGGRCIVRFAHDLCVVGEEMNFIAYDGAHEAVVDKDVIHLQMRDVSDVETFEGGYFMNTGSPHHVELIQNGLEGKDVKMDGAAVRNSEKYAPAGTNVNFIQHLEENDFFVRTFERGVEDETYACGTGVTACAIGAVLHGVASPGKIDVKVLGGRLSVTFDQDGSTFKNVFLIGPAVKVFEGSY